MQYCAHEGIPLYIIQTLGLLSMQERFEICVDKSHPSTNGPTLSRALTLMTSHVVVALSNSCSTLHEYCLQYLPLAFLDLLSLKKGAPWIMEFMS